MPTEPTLQLPFPDDEDWLNAGAYAIEQLARAVGQRHTLDVAVIERGDSPSTFAAGGSTPVTFAGAANVSGFTWDGITLTRTGPARLFVVHAEVEVNLAAGSTSTLETGIVLNNPGGITAGDRDLITSAAEDLTGRSKTHAITTAIQLGTGSALSVSAFGSRAGSVGTCTLRVHPCGPATS